MMAFLHTLLAFFSAIVVVITAANRSFTIDYDRNEFLKDGQVFRYVSGSMHYFRTPTELWRDRLRKIKFGGLNAVQIYIEWSSIETSPGVYDFSGNNNITRFIDEAQQEGLLVIVRPGPYICAERDMGGLPSWLLRMANIKMRSSDPLYMSFVDRWFNVLLPMLKPFLYHNGGPIIMVQVENEYGSYEALTQCDFRYTTQLRDIFRKLLGPDVVLFTTDGTLTNYYKCGKLSDVFTTIDFGITRNITRVIKNFDTLRKFQPNGPLVNSEFYSGWLDNWGVPHRTVSTTNVTQTLDYILSLNASVNIYMFHGGTNFGFTAGSDPNGNSKFAPVPTSYDYDAPISEAGDLTPKFFALKKIIEKYLLSMDTIQPIANENEKMRLDPVMMKFVANVFDVLPNNSIRSNQVKSFDQLNHHQGFVLYSSNVPFQTKTPVNISIPVLHDRALVFIDKKFAGILNSTKTSLQTKIPIFKGASIDVLVENQGSIFYGPRIHERKGILSKVYVQGKSIIKWTHYPLYKDWKVILKKLSKVLNEKFDSESTKLNQGPAFYMGQFVLPNKTHYPLDSFLSVTNWRKGVAFLNGHNLGRYWPAVGPQLTLYTPAVFFKPHPHINKIVLFELEQSLCSYGKRNMQNIDNTACQINFVQKHILNGTVHVNNI